MTGNIQDDSDPDPDRLSLMGQVGADYDRYADVTVEDGHVMVYDIDESDAWIQSNVAISIEDVS